MGHNHTFKAGYVSVAGFPNTGKSTLINRLVGSKIAIVTARPQTTRKTVKGILTTDRAQIVFLDTAGMHRPKDKLGRYMVDAALTAFREADIIYVMVECAEPYGHARELMATLQDTGKKKFLLLNKVDLVKKETLLPLIDLYSSTGVFDEIVPVSALTGDNIDKLLELTIDYLPESPPLYPEDVLSDQIERDFVAEFIREKVFLHTREEIPYSTAVVINDMKEREGGGAYVSATIYVEKDSQKGIIIGRQGSMIKKIGLDARRDIERFLGYAVYIDLRVKVEKKWRNTPGSLKKLGYR